MTTQTPDVKALADKIEAWSPSSGMLVFIARERRMLVDALRAAPEAPGAEPVAWEYETEMGDHGFVKVYGPVKPDTRDYRSRNARALVYASTPPADMRGTEEALRAALEAARTEIVCAIAFLGRDIGTDRLDGTIAGIIKRLVAADQAAQDVLATPPVVDAGIVAPPADAGCPKCGNTFPCHCVSFSAPPAASADAVREAFGEITGFGASYVRDADHWAIYTMPGVNPVAHVPGFKPARIDWILDVLRAALTAPVAGADASPSAMRERAVKLAKVFWCDRGGPPENFDNHLSRKFTSTYEPFERCMHDARVAIRALSPDAGVGMPSNQEKE